jgi:regulator of protease activity HflC (stomatin/prohibitin superfamily)
MIRRILIRDFEVGLLFRDGDFRGLLGPGRAWRFDPLRRETVTVVSQRDPWLVHDQLDMIVRSGALADRAVVLDIKDHDRGLVWIDDRFAAALGPGLYALWTAFRRVRAEVIDARSVRFIHPEFDAIARGYGVAAFLDMQEVPADHAGALFIDGRYVETLEPGRYAFWKGGPAVRLVRIDRREVVLDVSGQDILTADKVSIRLNAVVVYRVVDPLQAVTQTEDARQALYREAQLALRGAVGIRELDALLADKDAPAQEATDRLKSRAAEFGVSVRAVGVRDLILPGDMKDLMNKVIEARKKAEANVIVRREEAAALRHQVNAAKLFAENPALQRLRELEAVEKIAAEGKLRIVLGDKGLVDKLTNVL